MVVGPPQDSARPPCCRMGSAGPSGASGACGGHGQAAGCGLHDRSAPTPVGRTTCWFLPGGSLLWETGLLVSLSPPGRKLCPPPRDVGPLGQWRLRVPSGLWLEVALLGSSRATVEMSSTPFPLPGSAASLTGSLGPGDGLSCSLWHAGGSHIRHEVLPRPGLAHGDTPRWPRPSPTFLQ